jgi:hypothetical protein
MPGPGVHFSSTCPIATGSKAAEQAVFRTPLLEITEGMFFQSPFEPGLLRR